MSAEALSVESLSVQAPTPDERTEQHRRVRLAARELEAAGYSVWVVRDRHYLGERAVELAPPRCPVPLLSARWRPGPTGVPRYEALAGGIATRDPAELVSALDEVFCVNRETEVR